MASYISETLTVACRICIKQLLKKNYKIHLARTHPKQNSEDTTPYGQKTISSLFVNLTKKVKDITSILSAEDISENVGEQSMKSLEMGEEGSKYRHESGDSALETLQNIDLKSLTQKHPIKT